MEPRSYFGLVTAGNGFLLGGVKVHTSCFFRRNIDAIHWAETVARENRRAGRDVASVETYPSTEPYEIYGEKWDA